MLPWRNSRFNALVSHSISLQLTMTSWRSWRHIQRVGRQSSYKTVKQGIHKSFATLLFIKKYRPKSRREATDCCRVLPTEVASTSSTAADRCRCCPCGRASWKGVKNKTHTASIYTKNIVLYVYFLQDKYFPRWRCDVIPCCAVESLLTLQRLPLVAYK